MHIVLILIVLIAIIYGPTLWLKAVFKRYSKPRDDIPGNGAQLARHLLEKFDMSHVRVEKVTDKHEGDHYDPVDKAVRLSPNNYSDRSLTAITVAAHEVGHAIQDHRNEPLHNRRIQLVKIGNVIQQIGSWALVMLPVLAIISRNPVIGLLMLLAGICVVGISVVIHLVTLPVEYDASFNKALPILFEGNYIAEKDRPAARKILKAAALTYVAASLASLLEVWRWFKLMR